MIKNKNVSKLNLKAIFWKKEQLKLGLKNKIKN
jgi:hypothetical protein